MNNAGTESDYTYDTNKKIKKLTGKNAGKKVAYDAAITAW